MLKIARMNTNIFLIILKTNIYLNKFLNFTTIQCLISEDYFFLKNTLITFDLFQNSFTFAASLRGISSAG